MSLKSRRYLCPPGPTICAASVSSMNSGQEFFVQSPLQCCLQSHYVPSPSLLSMRMGKEPQQLFPQRHSSSDQTWLHVHNQQHSSGDSEHVLKTQVTREGCFLGSEG